MKYFKSAFILLSVLLLLFLVPLFVGCSSDDEKELVETRKYFSAKHGSFWIYHNHTTKDGINYVSQPLNDTLTIINDTVILERPAKFISHKFFESSVELSQPEWKYGLYENNGELYVTSDFINLLLYDQIADLFMTTTSKWWKLFDTKASVGQRWTLDSFVVADFPILYAGAVVNLSGFNFVTIEKLSDYTGTEYGIFKNSINKYKISISFVGSGVFPFNEDAVADVRIIFVDTEIYAVHNFGIVGINASPRELFATVMPVEPWNAYIQPFNIPIGIKGTGVQKRLLDYSILEE